MSQQASLISVGDAWFLSENPLKPHLLRNKIYENFLTTGILLYGSGLSFLGFSFLENQIDEITQPTFLRYTLVLNQLGDLLISYKVGHNRQ